MMRSTALDHASADRAWDHRDYGTDGDRATPSRGRRLRGATKAAAVLVFLLQACHHAREPQPMANHRIGKANPAKSPALQKQGGPDYRKAPP
jgi:hypothetical protein